MPGHHPALAMPRYLPSIHGSTTMPMVVPLRHAITGLPKAWLFRTRLFHALLCEVLKINEDNHEENQSNGA